MKLDLPFYGCVPKLPDLNLAYRAELLGRAASDAGLQRDLIYACKVDLLFWINSFCWLFEPRMERGRKKVVPFVTYPTLQDEPLIRMQRALGVENMLIEKSRDTGGTWKVLHLFLHEWLFGEGDQFGVVSRDADAVDKTGDTGSLFWKLRFIIGKEKEGLGLPSWMMPSAFTSNKFTLLNEDNGCGILGYAATGDVMRGDRKTAVLLDEFAAFPQGSDYDALSSVQFVTNCVILMSTPDPKKGASGAFYDEALKARLLSKR